MNASGVGGSHVHCWGRALGIQDSTMTAVEDSEAYTNENGCPFVTGTDPKLC